MPGRPIWTPGRKFFIFCRKADNPRNKKGLLDKQAIAEAHNEYFKRDAPKVVENGIKYALGEYKEAIPWPLVPDPRQNAEEDYKALSGAEFLRLYKAWTAAANQQRMTAASNGQMDSSVPTPSQIYHALHAPAASGPLQTSPSAQYNHSYSGSPSGQSFQPMGRQQNGAIQTSQPQPAAPMNKRPSVTPQPGNSTSPYAGQMGPSNQQAMSPLGIYTQASNQQQNTQGQLGRAAGGYGNPLAPPIYHSQPPPHASARISPSQQQRYQQNMQNPQGMRNHSPRNPLQGSRASPIHVDPHPQRFTQSVSPQNARLQQSPSQTRRSPSAPWGNQSRGSSMTQNSPLQQVLSQDSIPSQQRINPSQSPDFLSLDGYPALQAAYQQQPIQTQPWMSPSLSTTSGTTPARPQSARQNQRPSPNQVSLSGPNAGPAQKVHQSQQPSKDQFSASASGRPSVQNVAQSQSVPTFQSSASTSSAAPVQQTPLTQNAPAMPAVTQTPAFLQDQKYTIDHEKGVIQIPSPIFHGPVNIPPQGEGWGISFPVQVLGKVEPDCVISGPRYIVNMFDPVFLGGINFMGDLPASAYAAVPKVPIVAPASMRGAVAEGVPNPITPLSRKRSADEDIQQAEIKRQKYVQEMISREQQTPTPPAQAPVQTPRLPTPTTPAPVEHMTPMATTPPISTVPKQVTQATPETTPISVTPAPVAHVAPPPTTPPASFQPKQAAAPAANMLPMPTPPTTSTPIEELDVFDFFSGPPYSAQTQSLLEDIKETPKSPVPGSPKSKKSYVAEPLVHYSDLDVPFDFDPNKVPINEDGTPNYDEILMFPGPFQELTPEEKAYFAANPPSYGEGYKD